MSVMVTITRRTPAEERRDAFDDRNLGFSLDLVDDLLCGCQSSSIGVISR
jgi:hypothetical protein